MKFIKRWKRRREGGGRRDVRVRDTNEREVAESLLFLTTVTWNIFALVNKPQYLEMSELPYNNESITLVIKWITILPSSNINGSKCQKLFSGLSVSCQQK